MFLDKPILNKKYELAKLGKKNIKKSFIGMVSSNKWSVQQYHANAETQNFSILICVFTNTKALIYVFALATVPFVNIYISQ